MLNGLQVVLLFQRAWSSLCSKLLAKPIPTISPLLLMPGVAQISHCMPRSCWRIHALVLSLMNLVFAVRWNKSLPSRKKAIKLLTLVMLLVLVRHVSLLLTLCCGGLVKIFHSFQTNGLVAFAWALTLRQSFSTPWKIQVHCQLN